MDGDEENLHGLDGDLERCIIFSRQPRGEHVERYGFSRRIGDYGLIGKVFTLDTAEADHYRLFRITADLGHGFILADHCEFERPYRGMYDMQRIFHLAELAKDGCTVFDGFDEYERFEGTSPEKHRRADA